MKEHRQLSLTDVMLGMHRLSLQHVLSPANFRFFWGLIMLANTLKPRFKNPFNVTVNQAIGAGGGETRQAIHKRQVSLRKVKIDGQKLIKIVPGSNVKSRPALYEINYGLIVPPNLVVPVFGRKASTNGDAMGDAMGDAVGDAVGDAMGTILRSEEKREDPYHTIVNKVTTGKGADKNSGNDGGGFLLTEEKPEEDFEKARRELGYHQVKEPTRSELARKYETRYLMRQMAQIKRDFQKGIKFNNPGGALVARIKKGYTTVDYPE
jgi:hypothetical protein